MSFIALTPLRYPSGFDCARPCHSERSGAESNCEAAPSKAKVESRADSAQDDTQGATPSEKITKGVRAFCSYSFSHVLPARYSVLHLSGELSGGNEPPFTQGSLFLVFIYDLSIFLTSTAFVDTNTKTRYASYEMYRVFENCSLEHDPKEAPFCFAFL